MLQTSFNKKYTLYVNFDRAMSDGCVCVCRERAATHFRVQPFQGPPIHTDWMI